MNETELLELGTALARTADVLGPGMIAPFPPGVLTGAEQLLAVQQQERPVGPVRHLEQRDAAGLAYLGDAGAVSFAPHPALSPEGRGWDCVLRLVMSSPTERTWIGTPGSLRTTRTLKRTLWKPFRHL